MIHHLSIAARDPQHVAGVLAEFMGGVAVPFPPNPGSFFALQLDEHGSGVEVYPAGTELQPGGSDGGGFVKKPAGERGFGPTHFALSVTADADAVEAIAEREDWQCHRCNRGPFHVIEVWIENESMVEIPPLNTTPPNTSPLPTPPRSPRRWRRRRHAPRASARHNSRPAQRTQTRARTFLFGLHCPGSRLSGSRLIRFARQVEVREGAVDVWLCHLARRPDVGFVEPS